MQITVSFWGDVFIALTIGYSVMLVAVMAGLLRMRLPHFKSTWPTVSVIVAARNEAGRIEITRDSLAAQDYPADKFEVIWVDDASTDATAGIIRDSLKAHSNWRLLQTHRSGGESGGKQRALMLGLEQATGEIIALTDADCRVPGHWLRQMVSCFNDDTVMVLGHALLEKSKGFLNRWLRFDNLFAGLMTALPAIWGFPLTSVGRNMAYRKKAYLESGGYEALAGFKSGDDVHLTELFRRQVKGKIRFCGGKGAYVSSRPPETRAEIVQQQIRKNSKLLQKSVPAMLFTFFLLLYHVLLFTLPFWAPALISVWAIGLGAKLILEFIALLIAVYKFEEAALLPWLPLFQLLYPVYVIALGLIGSLGRFRWK